MKKIIKYMSVIILVFSIQGAKFVIDPTTNAISHNQKGIRFLEDGYYAAAIAEFRIAIALNADSTASATFYNNLGLTYLKLYKYDWAADCFEKAVVLNPNFIEYYKNLIKTYKAKGVLAKEVDKYIKIVKQNKSNSRAWLLLGLMYVELKYNYDAILCLKEFKKLEPDLVLAQGVEDIISKLH